MKSTLLLFALCLSLSGFTQIVYQNDLADLQSAPIFASTSNDIYLYGFNTSDYSLVYEAELDMPGFTIEGINALAVHPCNGMLYCVVKDGVNERRLGTIDIATGTVTNIGTLPDRFSSITFKSDGTLIGVTGDGATNPESLYQINTTDATATLLTALGNGDDGEAICFNPDDNMIYHWSGYSGPIMEMVLSVPPYTVTHISTTSQEVTGAAYIGNGEFVILNLDDEFTIIDIDGAVISSEVHPYGTLRGIGLPNRWVALLSSDIICSNESVALMAYGGSAYQWLKDGVPVAGATSAAFVPAQSGWYNCEITVNGCTDTAWFGKYLTVLNAPVVNINPSPGFICEPGDSVLLTGTGGGTSQWYFNGVMIPGATTNTLYALTPGCYNMVKTNLNGCSDSAAVCASVSLAPSGNTISPAGAVTICDDQFIVIHADPGGSFYAWLHNGSLVPFQSNDSLTVNQPGTYQALVAYGNCDADTSSNNLVVSVLNCSGIDKQDAFYLKAFPNPVTDVLMLQTDDLSLKQLSLIDLTGRILWRTATSETSITIDVRMLPAGMYVLSVQSGEFKKLEKITVYH